jgi:dienelactone hydrolase
VRFRAAIVAFGAALIVSACGTQGGPASPGGGAREPKWITIDAPEGHQLRGAVFEPVGEGIHPTVVVLHSDEGFTSVYVDVARQLADRGMRAIAACWFSGRARTVVYLDPPLDCPQAGGYADSQLWPGALAAIADSARQLSGADSQRIGIFANSGATIDAFALSASRSDIAAVVAVAGPYAGIQRGPGVPLLLLQGSASPQSQTLANTANAFADSLRNSGQVVESETYPDGDYSFLQVQPNIRDTAIARSADFFRKYVGTASGS